MNSHNARLEVSICGTPPTACRFKDSQEIFSVEQSLESDPVSEEVNDDQLAELERLRVRDKRIYALEVAVNSAAKEVEALKSELKEAREQYEACVTNLRNEIRNRDKPLPLFDNKQAAEASQENEDQSWRDVKIEDAGIPEKLCVFLLENKPPIETIGDLSEWTSKYQLTDINGIGPAKATQIEEALDAFWESRQPEDEGEEDAEDDAGEEEGDDD